MQYIFVSICMVEVGLKVLRQSFSIYFISVATGLLMFPEQQEVTRYSPLSNALISHHRFVYTLYR